MSEVEANIPETGPISVDDVLQAIQQKNVGRAKANFQDLMNQKVTDALESEKVRVASQMFNPHVDTNEPAPTAAELAAADGEEVEASLEDEVEAAFEEEEADAETD
jgi:hypothetical protein